MSDKSFKVIEIKLKLYETKTVTILQPASIPPRPKWMIGEPGYVESVARTCPNCRSADVWRGPWCHFPEAYYIIVRMKPPVRHSGRKRNCLCNACKTFWNDVQAIPYKHQEGVDV